MVDLRLRPDDGGWFTESRFPAVVEDARDFVEGEYFRDLCDIYEEVSRQNAIGADAGVVDHLRYRDVPIHLRRINAAYAGDLSEAGFSGSVDRVAYSSAVSELCFKLDTPLAVGDKIRLHATDWHPEQWYTLTSVDDFSTDALMVIARGTRIGIPDGISDE